MAKAFAPSKGFSQNFLTDSKISGKIVSQLCIEAGDTVVEIGPGTGALTKHLLESPLTKLICVELDTRSIAHVVEQNWSKDSRLTLVNKDILEVDLAQFVDSDSPAPLKVIGNIPYSITSPILFWLFENRQIISRAVIMMQREVAERCTATLGTKEYGIVSCASSFVGTAKIVQHVKPGSFFPKPKVSSSVVAFDFTSKEIDPVVFDGLMKFVRAAFSQRRKVLSNSLSTWMSSRFGSETKFVVDALSIDLRVVRAEQLSPVTLFDLYTEIVSAYEQHEVKE